MVSQHSDAPRSWRKLVLSGLLAFAFGIAAILVSGKIMFGRILEVIFDEAKPLSGSMNAVAALLALVALVAADGLINLSVPRRETKRLQNARRSRNRRRHRRYLLAWHNAFIAVGMIGLWGILIGTLELAFAHDSAKDRALVGTAAIASVVIGLGMMKWVFAGAVLVSALVGAGAAARGVSLILSGVHQQTG